MKNATMQTISLQAASDILEDASYLEAPVCSQDKVINFGVNDQGHQFVLIVSCIDGAGKYALI